MADQAQPAVQAGSHVTPHVRLVERLAGGEMGELWVGEHETLGTRVAVKFVHARYKDNAVALQRFHREARAAARVDSPHAVKVHDCGATDDGSAYIIMELLEGESVRAKIDRDGALSLHETTSAVVQVAHALESAHRAGVVHRDVKPDNIFIRHTDDGAPFVKLLDFGVATVDEGTDRRKLTNPGMLVGTPAYMSPELIRDGSGDELSDVWALSVAAYEMLVGELPFWGDSVPDVCASITEGTFTPPSQLVVGLEQNVDAIFERAFAPDPAARPQSAAELARELLLTAPDAPIAPTTSGLRLTPTALARMNAEGVAAAHLEPGEAKASAGPPMRSRRLWAIALASAIALAMTLGHRAIGDPPLARPGLTAAALSVYAAVVVPEVSPTEGTSTRGEGRDGEAVQARH